MFVSSPSLLDATPTYQSFMVHIVPIVVGFHAHVWMVSQRISRNGCHFMPVIPCGNST
jgi:hypothetical protein